MKWRKIREKEGRVKVVTWVIFTREGNETNERILLAVGLACLQLKTRDLPQICATKMIGGSKNVELQETARVFGTKIQLEETLKSLVKKIKTVRKYIYIHWTNKKNRRPSLEMDYVNSIPVKCFMAPQDKGKYCFNTWSFCNGVESSVDEVCRLAKKLLDENTI